MQDFIKINKDDNVAVALKPIAKGTTLNVAGIDVTTVEDIPQGHKFVIKAIKNGDPVIKYGFRIGFAQADIPVGAWVHTHNLKTDRKSTRLNSSHWNKSRMPSSA